MQHRSRVLRQSVLVETAGVVAFVGLMTLLADALHPVLEGPRLVLAGVVLSVTVDGMELSYPAEWVAVQDEATLFSAADLRRGVYAPRVSLSSVLAGAFPATTLTDIGVAWSLRRGEGLESYRILALEPFALGDGELDSFKTSAEIAGGNSGSLAINTAGQQIGIPTWGLAEGANKIDRIKMLNPALASLGSGPEPVEAREAAEDLVALTGRIVDIDTGRGVPAAGFFIRPLAK